MIEAEKRVRATLGALDSNELDAARKDLDSAFVDCTLHAQVAIRVARYLRGCSPENIAALLAEIDRLHECLKVANASAEHFEREWYLRGDEIDRLSCEHDKARAEHDALAKDAERGRLFVNGEWRRHDDEDRPDESYAYLLVRLPYDADLSCKAMRERAIDAQIEKEQQQ